MIFDRLFGRPSKAATPGPDDDFWYSNPGIPSLTGLNISQDTALGISAVWACVNAISQDVAKLPLIVYRRLANGGKERATAHPLYDVLHTQPNSWQTSYQWRQQMMVHLLLRGNAYCEIVPGPRGFADQLIPLHPDLVTVEYPVSGGMRYVVRERNGTSRVLTMDAMMHIVGLSLDGTRGVSVITYARETFGLALATEQYAALQFGKSPRPAGVLKHPGKLGETAAKNLASSFERAHSGPQNWQRVAVLEEGMEFQTIGLSAKDSQYLESRQFQVPEVTRWFRMPPHKIGDLSRATFSNIEQENLSYNIDTLSPWCVNFEQVIARDLILYTDTYFAEFLLDGLMRADSEARSNYYTRMVSIGIMTRNEARIRENLNPLPGLDEPLTPANITGTPAAEEDVEDVEDDEEPDDEAADNPADADPQRAAEAVPAPVQAAPVAPALPPQLAAIVTQAAARCVRKEIQAATKAAQRHAADAAAWSAWLDEFYTTHAAVVAEALQLPMSVAHGYATRQAQRLREGGLATVADWEWTVTTELANLALDPHQHHEEAA